MQGTFDRKVQSKAFAVNLDPRLYGTFAEIGAGQEVARHFFTAGGAAGTVAKTMSAYDMTFSDSIYGHTGRHVSRERLMTMLDHEFNLLVRRLDADLGAERTFFVFADTVTARSFRRRDESHGWIGLRFQHEPRAPHSDIIVHARMLDDNNLAQQEALGIFGVNLVHAAGLGPPDPSALIDSLLDDLGPERLEVDLIRLSGPAFPDVDNRIANLQLVVKGLANAVLFEADGEVVQAADAFHKKPLLVERGNFRPVTLLTNDMLDGALRLFEQEPGLEGRTPLILMEITMGKLLLDGNIDLRDFLDRVDMLTALGRTVLISNHGPLHRLVSWLTRHTAGPVGLPVGIPALARLFREEDFQDLEGGILEALGRLFKKDVRLYVHPVLAPDGSTVTCDNFHVAPRLEPLYRYARGAGMIRAVRDFNPAHLPIRTEHVLKLIRAGDSRWRDMVPPEVAGIIEDRRLFGLK